MRFEVPGASTLELEQLLLDVNGTLTRQGHLIPGVAERIAALSKDIKVQLLSSDTLGTLDAVGKALDSEVVRVERGEEKRDLVEKLGSEGCAAIGNGANDAMMLAAVALGIAVIGPEGASTETSRMADIVCPSINVALDLLHDEPSLASTLRP